MSQGMPNQPRKHRRRRHTDLPQFVQKHGSGYRGWYAEDGKQVRGPTLPTAELAHQWALERRLKPAPGDLTLEEGMDRVRRELNVTGRRKGTLEWYEAQFRALLRAWEPTVPLAQLDAREVEWFIERRLEHGVRPATVNHAVRALGRIFALAVRDGALSQNPVRNVRRPASVEPAIHRFSHEEIISIVEEVRKRNPEDADLVLFLYTTGLRRTEAAHVTVADLDLRGRELRVRHGKRRPRTLPVPDGLAALLERMAGRGAEYLVGPDPQRISRAFRRLASWVGEERLHAHALRHSFITHLAREGVPEHVIAALAGHKLSSSSITQHYVGVHGPQARAAMETFWR